MMGITAVGGGLLGVSGLVLAQATADPIVTASGAGVVASAGALMIWLGRKLLSGELVAKNTEEQLKIASQTIAELRQQGESDKTYQKAVLDQLRTMAAEFKTITEENVGALAVTHSVLLQLGIDPASGRRVHGGRSSLPSRTDHDPHDSPS
jgi:hypothetical protein